MEGPAQLGPHFGGHFRSDDWEGLGARGEGDDRGWDGWMASLTRWTRVSVNSRSWWWTGRPGMLRFMESQRVGHDCASDLIWSDLMFSFLFGIQQFVKLLHQTELDRTDANSSFNLFRNCQTILQSTCPTTIIFEKVFSWSLKEREHFCHPDNPQDFKY